MSFSFISEPGAILECKLDAAAFTACVSPKSYTNLTNGSHTFQVRAIDTAGNADPTPATHTWTVNVPAPSCSATVTGASDTSPTAGGTVTINVNLNSNGIWSTRATLSPSTTTWSGSDSGNDPLWRIGWRCDGVWINGASFDP